MIIKIQKRWDELEKKKYNIISHEFDISQLSAKKYIQMSEEEINALDYPNEYKKRTTMGDDYINIIYKMLRDGIIPEVILAYVLKLGYQGTIRAITLRIERMAKNNFGIELKKGWYSKYEYPSDITVIKRKDVLKYITTRNPKIKKDKTIEANIEIIKEKFPTIEELEKSYISFHEILMGKDSSKLDDFIETYKDSSIKSFVDGIKKDIAPVKNAISYETSSGFVEGNNNKFKLIKRILYGRSKLVNLFRKCYLPFLMNNVNFKLSSVIK